MSLASAVQKRVLSVFSGIAPASTGQLFFKLWFKTKRYALRPEEEVSARQARVKKLTAAPGEILTVYEWGSGPVALLVHGWNGRATQFHKVVELLRSKGYMVVAYDAPGHGMSSGSETDLPAMAAAIGVVCGHYGSVELMISHSLGGLAAGKSIADGCKVKQLIMIAPPSSIGDLIDITWKELSLSASAKKVLRDLFEKKYGIQVWKNFSFAGFGQNLNCVGQVAVIHDRQDKEIPLAQGERVSGSIDNCRFLTTAGLGHRRILQSEEFLNLMETCLVPTKRGCTMPHETA
jgi:hypothetical protein